jgi:carotenoid cleavage dioxygenase
VFDCDVIGKIPADLNGAFVRVGGDWLYPPTHADDSPFHEDGYVSLFRFKDGVVDYKGRWIRTEHYLNNQKAHRQLYGYYRNPFTDDESVRDPARPFRRTVSNTAPLAHAGKLFATKEDGLPTELDPKTLATLGPYNFHGAYKSQTFTAHSKIDPVSGEMITFGYEATGLCSDDLFLYVIDRHGKVKREIRIKVPYVSMVHDIAITQKHIVIPVYGYVTSLERLKEGRIHWGWDASKPSFVGILPRDGEARDLRWFRGPERATVHTFNARTEGSKVILDAPIFDSNPFPFFPNVDGSQWNPQKGRATIRRQTFDLDSSNDTFTEEELFPAKVVDLCRIDPRYLSLPTRYGFLHYADATRPLDEARTGLARGRAANCYGRFDFATGQMTSYFAGETHTLQECCFVPRGRTGTEGDGYLIGVANNLAEARSELVIADAQNLAAGDIARVILPFRSNVQVHGTWVDHADMSFA